MQCLIPPETLRRLSMRNIFFFFFILIVFKTNAQNTDSVYYQLQEVEVKPVSRESLLRLLTSESSIIKEDLNHQSSSSLLSAVNIVPGVRMEERSPGSYRLSIRGSLLRSPFGVRNVKIYLGDFSFTDAGGNTYLNSLDVGNINSIKILKGPEASIFGANTGGVLLIDPVQKTTDSLRINAALNVGSYGLLHENFFIQKRWKNSLINISQGYQKSHGYRDNSAIQRHYTQAAGVWNYNTVSQLKILILFSYLKYQTPGGLTLSQVNLNPRSARPATATLPGAAEQKAGVLNKTFFGGISHEANITKNLRHIISVFGSQTDFQNPFITNYEHRVENTYGARTYFDLNMGQIQKIKAKLNIGAEWQRTNAVINNYGNRKGTKDTLQAGDEINAGQSFLFARFLVDIKQRLLLEVSASYNFFGYRFKNRSPFHDSVFNRKNFNPQFMPRIAFSYLINQYLSWRVSASGGYSAPTIAEVRSSNNIVNTTLQAEKALSYETGLRVRDRKDNFWFDISAFYYSLQNAIVRRTDTSGNEYFINAGGTKQPGLEAQLKLAVIKPRNAGIIRALLLTGNITYSNFTFSNYKINAADYSNNKLSGVPEYTSAENVTVEFPYRFSLYVQYYYSAGIPLNDANSVFANKYDLVQLKGEWKKQMKRFNFSLFAGIDNLLNEKYSLGNDLNAVGGRYYNPAPPVNYYGGIKVEW